VYLILILKYNEPVLIIVAKIINKYRKYRMIKYIDIFNTTGLIILIFKSLFFVNHIYPYEVSFYKHTRII